MNRDLIDKLARALLYEGYVLYPYRPSVKNTQRWTFGGIHPKAWSEAQNGTDPFIMQTQCLLEANATSKIAVTIRFLHLIDRDASWQESTEREVATEEIELGDLLQPPRTINIEFPAGRVVDGEVVRTWQTLQGSAEISALKLQEAENSSPTSPTSPPPVPRGRVREGASRESLTHLNTPTLYQLTVRIENQTELPNAQTARRDDALLRSFISTHTILTTTGGAFVSLTDPAEQFATAAAKCQNIGAWPVLVGENNDRDMLLSSPIILYDYPQLAPESPGDLFDGTEIDEILTLRIMTLTDEEKRAAAATDNRVRELLSRTESLARDQLMSLHGTIRGLKPVQQEQTHD
jgi:hypothetical protein